MHLEIRKLQKKFHNGYNVTFIKQGKKSSVTVAFMAFIYLLYLIYRLILHLFLQ